MTKNRTRLKRYHRDIFFPDWAESSLETFKENLVSEGKLTFSLHALEKMVDYSFEYGKIITSLLLEIIRVESANRESFFSPGNIFEFYTIKGEIRKACYRYSFDEIPVDLILVISSEGVVITAYLTNKGDKHKTLNKNLYERN